MIVRLKVFVRRTSNSVRDPTTCRPLHQDPSNLHVHHLPLEFFPIIVEFISLPRVIKLPILHWAFRACSCSLGAVVADFSRSAAHRAAPTVFVKAKTRFANGIISSKKEMTPNLLLLIIDQCHPNESYQLTTYSPLDSAPRTHSAVSSTTASTESIWCVQQDHFSCLVAK